MRKNDLFLIVLQVNFQECTSCEAWHLGNVLGYGIYVLYVHRKHDVQRRPGVLPRYFVQRRQHVDTVELKATRVRYFQPSCP